MPCTKCKEEDKYKWGESGSCKYATKADCEKANPKHVNYDKDGPSTTKITELVISDDNQDLAIDCISLVSQPAIEVDFVYLNKQKNNLTMGKINEHKREIVSPALIPDKSIFRYDPNTQSEFYVYFSKETVRKASILYLKNNNHHKATVQHEERIAGILTVESWIVEDPKKDKSSLYGFKMPVGTWMVRLQVNNEEIWERIVSQEIKGLSIEGYFIDKLEKMASVKSVEPTDEEVLTALAEILNPKKEVKNKVELSTMGDLTKMVEKMKPLQKKAQTVDKQIRAEASQASKLITKLKGTLKSALTIQQDGYEYLDPAKALLEKVENGAKELGVDPNTIPGYKEAKAVRGDAYYDYKGLADAYWEAVSPLTDEVGTLKSVSPL